MEEKVVKREGTAKNWAFTVFTDEDKLPCLEVKDLLVSDRLPDVGYLVGGYEVCPSTGTPHWQCYLQLRVRKRKKFVFEMIQGLHEAIKSVRVDKEYSLSSPEKKH